LNTTVVSERRAAAMRCRCADRRASQPIASWLDVGCSRDKAFGARAQASPDGSVRPRLLRPRCTALPRYCHGRMLNGVATGGPWRRAAVTFELFNRATASGSNRSWGFQSPIKQQQLHQAVVLGTMSRSGTRLVRSIHPCPDDRRVSATRLIWIGSSA